MTHFLISSLVVCSALIGYIVGLLRGYRYGKASGRAELTIELMEGRHKTNEELAA